MVKNLRFWNHPFYILIILLIIPTFSSADKYDDRSYKLKTIVLDAGHGGDIPGALGPPGGTRSREKDLVLQVALKLGKAIEAALPDVRVLYTRSTDVNVDLYKRIEFANENKADIFISIHCNAHSRRTARGTETLVSGFHRLGEQDAAIRENADILLEENYEENYHGFDPSDPESYVIFSLMKNHYREHSIKLASFIQDEFVKSGRVDRGVKEQGLAVLARAGMPAVLTEIGFISNVEEERYMKSDAGQAEIVKNLLDAITAYKRQMER